MKPEFKHDVRRLLSGSRAIINVDGLCRVQFMPSGRIHKELVEPWAAKIFCKTFNGCTPKDSIHSEQAVAVSYEEIFAANTKAMKRLGKRKKKRSGKK